MQKYERGDKYHIRYKGWHNDPEPYLYITHSDTKYTEGFNLHYLPNIRFRIPLDRYKRINRTTWAKAYRNMKDAGMFRGFLKILDKASEGRRSRSQFRVLVKMVSKRYPWAMKSYRRYHTNKIRVLSKEE